MNVVALGWGAEQDAIDSACRLAGHEPKATRWRREPIDIVEPDFATEHPSGVRVHAGATVIRIREARERRRATTTTDVRAAKIDPSASHRVGASHYVETQGIRAPLR